MKKLFFIISIVICFNLKGQPVDISYEWFSLSGGFLYSVEDQYTGLNGKINLPLGSHAKFVMQASDVLKVKSDTASSADVWVSAVDDIST